MAKTSRITRKTQLVGREEVREQLLKTFIAVEKGYNDQATRADATLDNWDAYNCKLGSKQFYAGNSRLFVPLIHNAVEARKTRYMNQMFPQSGHNVKVVTEDGEVPHGIMALLEYYVKRADLRTKVVPPLMVAGDVEGIYAVCVTWGKRTRHTVSRETSPLTIGGIEHPDLGDVETLKEEDVVDEGPDVDIIPDPDLLVLPATSDSIEAALDAGGSVTTICRWTKERIQELIDSGEIDKEFTAQMLAEMHRGDAGQLRDVPRKLADYAGIRAGGTWALVYRTWTKIKIQGERRLVLAYYGGENELLGCKLCPYWCDKPDIIAGPVKKMPGVFKGPSLVAPCTDMQYAANDALNEAMDSAAYGLLPIIMTDPQKNPKFATMVADQMAVWEVSPNDTKILQIPILIGPAFEIVSAAERYINQTLSVSPAGIPQSTGVPGRRRTQAEVALEQQAEILMTADAVTVWEGTIGTPLMQRFAEYDAQFRDAEIAIRSMGEIGVEAEMEVLPPLQMGKRWQFSWNGVEVNRTAQSIQQKISAFNVIGNLAQSPAVKQAGWEVDPIPLIRDIADAAFSPETSKQIFKNRQKQLSLPPELENEMLSGGMPAMVSPHDDDAKHIQVHLQGMQATQDIQAKAAYANHIAEHQQAMKMKQAAMVMQQLAAAMQPGGAPGAPRGARPGAQAAMPRGNAQQPAGRIHPDQMKGAGVVPRPKLGLVG